jgi:hypothetical protein
MMTSPMAPASTAARSHLQSKVAKKPTIHIRVSGLLAGLRNVTKKPRLFQLPAPERSEMMTCCGVIWRPKYA